MKKNFRKNLFGLISFSLFLSCAGRISKKERIAALNDSVFCISILVKKDDDSEKRVSVGTGFLIDNNLIASALHVQSKSEDLMKYFKNSPYKLIAFQKLKSGEVIQFPIEIAIFDKENDLAIYKFDNQILRKNQTFAAIKPLPIAANPPTLGEEVVSIGYYGEYEFPFNSIGNVAMIDANDDIYSDLTLMPGNSGAPVCDLETGSVLGVTTAVLDLGNETVRYGIAKKSAKLIELWQKLKESPSSNLN